MARRRRWCGGSMVTLVAVAVLAAPVGAATPSSVVVSGGPLTLAAPATASVTVAFDATASSRTAPLDPFFVTDARGTGAGWDLVVQATALREWDGAAYVDEGHALPHGSLTLTGLEVSAQDDARALPEVLVDAAALDGSSVTVVGARPDAGMGRFGFVEGVLVVTLPADAPAGTYRSELSLSLTSGP